MSENTERRYLKWYNKVGYGSGDVAGNVVYAFLSSFVMIYLTDTVGLNPGIVGTLIAVSKLFDGILEMDNGYIKTDDNMHTNIPGVFAAGAIRVKSLRQVVTAAADGAVAAMQAEKFINE